MINTLSLATNLFHHQPDFYALLLEKAQTQPSDVDTIHSQLLCMMVNLVKSYANETNLSTTTFYSTYLQCPF